jgi:hypothetical protein
VPSTIERPASPAVRRRGAVGAVIGTAVLGSLLSPVVAALEDGRRADLVVVNDSPYDLGVRLTGADGAVLHVAHVRRVTTRVVRDVLHPGGPLEVTWTHEGRPVASVLVPEGEQLSPPPALRGG